MLLRSSLCHPSHNDGGTAFGGLHTATVHRRIADYAYFKWTRGEKAMGAHHGVTTLHNGQKIIVHTKDQHVCDQIRRHGVWEKEQVVLLQHLIRPGFHIIEWGANYGAHTLFMAQKVGPTGHVWAFEPNPHVYPYLEQSIALNQLGDRITLHKTGVSNAAQSTSPIQQKTSGAAALTV